MVMFDARKVKQISGICSPRVTAQFMANKHDYKRVANRLLDKWCMSKVNSLTFDNNPKYNGVVKIIMHLGPVFAN